MSTDFYAIPVRPVEYVELDSSLKFIFRDEDEQRCDRVFTAADIPFLEGMRSQIRNPDTRRSMDDLIRMIRDSVAGLRLVEMFGPP